MAFASTVSGTMIIGNRKEKWGTFSNGDGDTGGNITTGLKTIETHELTINSHRTATLPQTTTSGGTLTVVTEDGIDGTWRARGR